jgi:hypothetical protein
MMNHMCSELFTYQKQSDLVTTYVGLSEILWSKSVWSLKSSSW